MLGPCIPGGKRGPYIPSLACRTIARITEIVKTLEAC
jgi:hypothetical protein